jgi:hypothetical protein
LGAGDPQVIVEAQPALSFKLFKALAAGLFNGFKRLGGPGGSCNPLEEVMKKLRRGYGP